MRRTHLWWGSIMVGTLLTACGGQAECDDRDVLNQIRKETLLKLKAHQVGTWSGLSADVAEAAMNQAKADVTEIQVADVFNFRKLGDGTRTCKAKLSATSVNGEHSVEMKYSVVNYEDGYQISMDDAGDKLVGAIMRGYVDRLQREKEAVRAQNAENVREKHSIYQSKVLQGNVCADNLDERAFVRDFVNQDLGSWEYEYDTAVTAQVKQLLAGRSLKLVDIQTGGNNPEGWQTADELADAVTYYRCTADLTVTLADGRVFSEQGVRFGAKAKGPQFIGYEVDHSDGRLGLNGVARLVARKIKYDY